MRQELTDAENYFDDEGNPTGGFAHLWVDTSTGPRRVVYVQWQSGPLGRGDERRSPNGAFVETVIEIARQRLEFFQSSKFECDQNAIAIGHLEKALAVLGNRTADRETRGVEGLHEP